MEQEPYTVVELLGELEQALNKIEFLHGCLTDKNHEYREAGGTYHYAYPEMTLEHIERLSRIVGPRHYCSHSCNRPECPACQESSKKRATRATLNEKIPLPKRSACTCICHRGWSGWHGEHTCCIPD